MSSIDAFDFLPLRRCSHAEFIFRVDNIVTLGLAHQGLQKYSEDVAGPPILKEMNAEYASTVHAAENRDRLLIEIRDAKRVALEDHVIMWGQHINMLAVRRDDPSLLVNTGFDQKKKTSSKTSNGPTPKPTDLTVKHGTASGILQYKVKRMSAGGTYEFQISTDPTNEAAWGDAGHDTHSKQETKNAIPGTKYYIRARYHGVNGTGPWSEPVSIFAI